MKAVQVGEWYRLPFSGQIVEVLAVKPRYAVVWRADGTIEPFGAPIVKLRPLDHATWRAMKRDFADAWRATFREPVRQNDLRRALSTPAQV